MKFPIVDYQRLRELIAENGIELTPNEFAAHLHHFIGDFQLVDEVGIADLVGRGNELGNKWFNYIVSEITKENHNV